MREPDKKPRVAISLDRGMPSSAYARRHPGQLQPWTTGGIDWDRYLRLALPNLISEVSSIVDLGYHDDVIDPAALEGDLARVVEALRLALPQGRASHHPPPPGSDARVGGRRVNYQFIRGAERKRCESMLLSTQFRPADFAALLISMANEFSAPKEPQRHVRCRLVVSPSSSSLIPRTAEAEAASTLDQVVALLERGDFGIGALCYGEAIPDDESLGLCRSQLFWHCAATLPAAPFIVDAIPPFSLSAEDGYFITPAEVGPRPRPREAVDELFGDDLCPAIEAVISL